MGEERGGEGRVWERVCVCGERERGGRREESKSKVRKSLKTKELSKPTTINPIHTLIDKMYVEYIHACLWANLFEVQGLTGCDRLVRTLTCM